MNPAELVLNYLLGLTLAITPCVFPVLPIFLLYITGSKASRQRAFLASALFALGFTASFLAMVYAAILAKEELGELMRISLSLEYAMPRLAVLLIAMGIAMFTPLKRAFAAMSSPAPRFAKLSLLNAFALGLVFTIIAAPCGAASFLAFLISVLVRFSFSPQALATVTLQALAYTLGASTPFLALGALTQEASRRLHRKLASSFLVKRSGEIMGLLLVVYGAFMLYGEPRPLDLLGQVARRDLAWVPAAATALVSLAVAVAAADAYAVLKKKEFAGLALGFSLYFSSALLSALHGVLQAPVLGLGPLEAYLAPAALAVVAASLAAPLLGNVAMITIPALSGDWGLKAAAAAACAVSAAALGARAGDRGMGWVSLGFALMALDPLLGSVQLSGLPAFLAFTARLSAPFMLLQLYWSLRNPAKALRELLAE